MGDIVDGDDGLPAEEVGEWAAEKLGYLCNYIDISRVVRNKYLPPNGQGGAGYIDLFCGTGRCRVRKTDQWIDGSPVAAWKKSCETGAPFSKIILADIDQVRLDACVQRLEALGAPVVPLLGPASETAFKALQRSPPYGLNLAFLDPYSLGALEFGIIRELARLKRVDILVHVSKMDMQRNLAANIQSEEETAFDYFAPGWREAVDTSQQPNKVRSDVMEYWRGMVAETNVDPSQDIKLIKGNRGQHLYWLLLVARHDLAHKFWKVASDDGQQSLF